MPYVAATLAASLLIAAIGLVYWNATRSPNNGPKDNFVENNNVKPEIKTPPEPQPTPMPTPKKINPQWPS